MTHKDFYCRLFVCPGSGPVGELSLLSVNGTTLGISFAAPLTPNGAIIHYEITVEKTMDAPENLTHSFAHSDQKQDYLAYITALSEDV